ncbi:MAG: hypothetical protein JXQ89_14995 [Pelagimonas sp.]
MFAPSGTNQKHVPFGIDPALVGVWKREGTVPPTSTFEITAQYAFLIGGPPSPVGFSADGLTLDWGGIQYDHHMGTPGQLIGIWRNRRDGDEWYFRADGSVTVHWSSTEEYFGHYQLVGDQLAYQEFRATVTTHAGQVKLDPPYAPDTSYGYVVQDGVMTWSDAADGSTVISFDKA